MRHYSEIIIAPVVTEKSMALRSENVYTFKVAKDATKTEIKKAIEDAFTSDGALYLRLVLTDQRSLNIRNLLCHGIVPPQYFESGAAARLLHVLIMLGMVKETS